MDSAMGSQNGETARTSKGSVWFDHRTYTSEGVTSDMEADPDLPKLSTLGVVLDDDASSVTNVNVNSKSPIVFVIEEDHVVKSHKVSKVNKASRSDQASLLSSIYAILLILLGLLFPLTEAITEKWLEEIYSAVFLVYIFTIGTAFLIYLQVMIYHESRVKKKARDSPNSPGMMSPNGVKSKSSSVIIGNSRLAGLTPGGSEVGTPYMSRLATPNDSPRTRRKRHQSQESALTMESVEDVTGALSFDLEAIKNIFAHEGSSFYLRLGAMVFSIGVMIYIGLELEFHMDANIPEECNSAKYGWTFIFHLIFVVVQTFFIFKYPKVHITSHAPLARFGFMHLIATNLCVWLRTLSNEIQEEFHHKMDHHYDDNNDTVTSMVRYECDTERKLLLSASPYLFPFVMEYSLIATGVAAIMYDEMNARKRTDMIQSVKNALKARDTALDAEVMTSSHRTHAPGEVALHNAHRGVFLGILLLSGMVICIILFYFNLNSGNGESAQMVYLISDIVMHTIMLLAAFAGLFQLNKLYHTNKPFSVDDALLMLAMSGSFLFEVSIALSTSLYISDNGADHILILTLTASLIAGIQTIVQAVLIMAGLRKYSATTWHLKHMPGRETITFMIIGNVTLWIFRTMQVKELELGVQDDVFGTLAWLLLMNLNLPLLLFYRFHASVCLADIWHIAYHPLHRKLDYTFENQDVSDYSYGLSQEQNTTATVRRAASVLSSQANRSVGYSNPAIVVDSADGGEEYDDGHFKSSL